MCVCADVWQESECEKVHHLASMFMEGLIMQGLGGPLIKKRGREGWLQDLKNALRFERKGCWHTDPRRVSQLLRSLETNLPWRTMSEIFRQQRAPLLSSIKVCPGVFKTRPLPERHLDTPSSPGERTGVGTERAGRE